MQMQEDGNPPAIRKPSRLSRVICACWTHTQFYPKHGSFFAINGKGEYSIMSKNSGYSQARLTEMVARLMINQRFAHVKATKVPCFLPCDPVGDFTPDATGYAEGTFIIANAASEIRLSDPVIWQQWATFYHHARRLGGHLVIAVDKTEEDTAWHLLENICGEAANAHVWAF